MARDPRFSKRHRYPAVRRHRRRSGEGGAREAFAHPRRVPFPRPLLRQDKHAELENWSDNPRRIVGEDGDGAISLRLPVDKFVENNHRFTLALRSERFKDLKPVDALVYGAIQSRFANCALVRSQLASSFIQEGYVFALLRQDNRTDSLE